MGATVPLGDSLLVFLETQACTEHALPPRSVLCAQTRSQASAAASVARAVEDAGECRERHTAGSRGRSRGQLGDGVRQEACCAVPAGLAFGLALRRVKLGRGNAGPGREGAVASGGPGRARVKPPPAVRFLFDSTVKLHR